MCQGEQDAPALCLLRSNPLGTSGFTLGTSVNPARGRGWSCFFPPPPHHQPREQPGTCGGSYGTITLCLPVTGSSTYWERLLPSTRMRWLAGADWPARQNRRVRGRGRPGCSSRVHGAGGSESSTHRR